MVELDPKDIVRRGYRADVTTVDFEPESFDAVVSLYALIHIPVDERPVLGSGECGGSLRR